MAQAALKFGGISPGTSDKASPSISNTGRILLHFSFKPANDNSSGDLDKLFEILHEDADLLIINKPADLVCHPTKGDVYSSLISRVRLHLGPDAQPRLINRLDRETSGVTVVAKNPASAGELGTLWAARLVEKEYLAIVRGHPVETNGWIEAALGKDLRSAVAIKDGVRADGLPARTEFRVERKFVRTTHPRTAVPPPHASPETAGTPGQAFSLLRVIPHTGRKHQIRIHLAYRGHPIVGDKLYGGDESFYLALVERRLTPEQRERLLLPHQALHARVVRFAWRGRTWEFGCEPEPWFRDFLGGPPTSPEPARGR